jgi:hypothetical protein
MFKSPFIILAAVGVISLGGYFLFNRAVSYAAKEATLKCELAHKNQAIEAAKEAAKDKEDIENEVRKIDDIDAYGLSLGILRPDSDR